MQASNYENLTQKELVHWKGDYIIRLTDSIVNSLGWNTADPLIVANTDEEFVAKKGKIELEFMVDHNQVEIDELSEEEIKTMDCVEKLLINNKDGVGLYNYWEEIGKVE